MVTHRTQARTGVRYRYSRVNFSESPVVDMSLHGEHTGTARRRRERRLRSFWRHEQMAIQMVLVTVQHYSYGAPLGQITAIRTGEGGNEKHYTADFWELELISLFEEGPGGVRPGSVTDPAPQETVERHIVERRAPSCRSLMLQCSWWRPSGTSICTSLSWLSKCPRSHLHAVVLAGARFLWCRQRNSWW